MARITTQKIRNGCYRTTVLSNDQGATVARSFVIFRAVTSDSGSREGWHITSDEAFRLGEADTLYATDPVGGRRLPLVFGTLKAAKDFLAGEMTKAHKVGPEDGNRPQAKGTMTPADHGQRAAANEAQAAQEVSEVLAQREADAISDKAEALLAKFGGDRDKAIARAERRARSRKAAGTVALYQAVAQALKLRA